MRIAVAAALVFCGLALAQYPGQYPPNTYPPNTYPPGTYPPGTYPPNTYPPNTYPTRLPGGVPIGVPVPEVSLPKKQPKEKSGDDVKVTLAAVDGALRKMGEKELFVETARKQILRFRLLAKTQFRNKVGDPVRDSLLHPGDQLSVQVNTDDEETALRVTLLRNGTDAERRAAERRFDEATARAPKPEDLGKSRTVTARESEPAEAGTADASESAKPETAKPETEAAPASSAGSTPAPGAIPSRTDDQSIADARQASSQFSAGLPNYLADQVTKRYYRAGPSWQLIDEVGAEVAYVDGKEDYRKITVDGQPVSVPPEKTGSWSTGEFGTTLEDLMSSYTRAAFRRRGEDRVGSRPAMVFDYQVEQPNSHWTIVAPDGRRFSPPYEGAVWIDKETARVLRIEQRTTFMPSDFPYTKAESILEYAYARIDQKSYLMPASGDNLACMRGSGACSRNAITFRNYRKFTADSNIDYK